MAPDLIDNVLMGAVVVAALIVGVLIGLALGHR